MDRFKDLDKGERISEEAQFISNEADYVKFLKRLYDEEGLDLSLYKQNQMRRRINMSVRQAGKSGYCQFLDYAKLNIEVYRRFIDRITINVSEFFRNDDKFRILEEQFFIPMLKRNPTPLIWSAGCSTGEEPYTLALLLEKHNARSSVQVLGWDFDKNALKRAADGIYEEKSLKNVPQDLKSKYFVNTEGTMYQVSDRLKKRVKLEQRNMLEDRFPANVDMILCRNVVIYFKEDAKQVLFDRFGKALAPEGVLMIGSSERITNYQNIGLRTPEPFFYVRKESGHAASFKPGKLGVTR